jgi:hypothetical protein
MRGRNAYFVVDIYDGLSFVVPVKCEMKPFEQEINRTVENTYSMLMTQGFAVTTPTGIDFYLPHAIRKVKFRYEDLEQRPDLPEGFALMLRKP